MKDDDAEQPGRDAALARLWERLQAHPRQHDFFATLRRIEALHPELPRLGESLRPSQDPLRLGQEPGLDFAPAGLHALETAPDRPPLLRVLLFGLLGPNGPMPLHLTEYTRQRLRHDKDPVLSRFLDVFHHRLLTLFYRSWAQNQPTVQRDRPTEDRFGVWLGSCAGLAGEESAQLFQASLLSQRSRHPEGLTKLLMQRLRMPVRIEQHVAQWLDIDEADRLPLGYAHNRAERHQIARVQLGIAARRNNNDAARPEASRPSFVQPAISGRKRLDRQYKFRVVVLASTRGEYESLLPGTPAWHGLLRCVHQYAGFDLRWELNLVLAAAAVPQPRPDQRLRLGVASWIGRDVAARDRADLRLRPRTSFMARQADGEMTFDAGRSDAKV